MEDRVGVRTYSFSIIIAFQLAVYAQLRQGPEAEPNPETKFFQAGAGFS